MAPLLVKRLKLHKIDSYADARGGLVSARVVRGATAMLMVSLLFLVFVSLVFYWHCFFWRGGGSTTSYDETILVSCQSENPMTTELQLSSH